MFKLNETITHTLSREEFLTNLRRAAGIIFNIGDVVTYTPKPKPEAERTAQAEPQTSTGHSPFRPIEGGIAIDVSELIRQATGRASTPADQHAIPCEHCRAILEKPGQPFIVVGFDGDGDVCIVTMDENGDLHRPTVPASDLSLAEVSTAHHPV